MTSKQASMISTLILAFITTDAFCVTHGNIQAVSSSGRIYSRQPKQEIIDHNPNLEQKNREILLTQSSRIRETRASLSEQEKVDLSYVQQHGDDALKAKRAQEYSDALRTH